MNIRPFSLKDTEQVVALWNECGLVVPWNDPVKDIERKMQVQPELFIVAEKDGDVIATLMGGYDGHRGWVNYLAVSPHERGHSLGQKLIETTEQALIRLGCPKLNLQVRSTNTQMIDYYRALGYQEDNAVGMGKRLIPDA